MTQTAPDLMQELVEETERLGLYDPPKYATTNTSEGCSKMDKPQTAPDGWKLVPIEPTNEMILALAEQSWLSQEEAEAYLSGYAEMLKAAPEYKP